MASDTDRERTPDSCSPDTSFITPPKKRGHCDSETDHSSETDSIGSEKRFKIAHPSDTSECSTLSRTESESPVFLDNISNYTSKWTAEVLPCFRVRVEQTAKDAYNVFSQGCLYFICDQQKCSELMSLFGSRNEKDKIIADCFHHILQHTFAVHCDSVSELKMKDLVDAENAIMNTEWIENFAARGNQTKVREKLCEDISKKLKAFIWQLMHMVRTIKLQREIPEGMYQELFILYLRVFDLHTIAYSNVEKYTVDIGGSKKIVAIPDAVIIHPTTEEEKICAVIEVKKFSEDDVPSSHTTRSLRSCEKNLSTDVEHVGSDLRGQHVGQALCSLPFSLFGDRGIFGILVQGTKVTISSFKADDTYFQNLCNGFLLKKEATLTFSKEYNILRREGRLELLQTFLDLKKLLEYQSGKNYS